MQTKEHQRAEPATIEMVVPLIGHLRKEDHVECMAMSGRDADICLVEAVRRSGDDCFVGMIGDDPVLAFGCAPQSILSFSGVPWMLASERISEVKFKVVKQSRGFIKGFLRNYGVLENFVHAENKISIKWLEWCGFNIGNPEPIGRHGELFHHFWMRGE